MLGFWIFSLFMQMKVSDWRVSKRGAAEFKPLPASLLALDKIFLSPSSANSLHVNHGLSQHSAPQQQDGLARWKEERLSTKSFFSIYVASPASANAMLDGDGPSYVIMYTWCELPSDRFSSKHCRDRSSTCCTEVSNSPSFPGLPSARGRTSFGIPELHRLLLDLAPLTRSISLPPSILPSSLPILLRGHSTDSFI